MKKPSPARRKGRPPLQTAASHDAIMDAVYALLQKKSVRDLTAEESLRFRVRQLIDAFNGRFGKIVAGLIAEGQSEPAILQEFFDRWVSPRRNASMSDLQRGKNAGELRSETEPELLNDAIFGAIYYRLLLRSGPLTKRFGEELVEHVLRGQRAGSDRGRS